MHWILRNKDNGEKEREDLKKKSQFALRGMMVLHERTLTTIIHAEKKLGDKKQALISKRRASRSIKAPLQSPDLHCAALSHSLARGSSSNLGGEEYGWGSSIYGFKGARCKRRRVSVWPSSFFLPPTHTISFISRSPFLLSCLCLRNYTFSFLRDRCMRVQSV